MSRGVLARGGPTTGAAPMKHKTWFRLVLKATGVLLIGLAVSDLLTLVIGVLDAVVFAERWTMYSPYGSQMTSLGSAKAVTSSLLSLLPSVAQVGFGLYLLFGGKWIVNLCIPSNRPYCPECGYDLSKTTSANCPECGVKLPCDNSTG